MSEIDELTALSTNVINLFCDIDFNIPKQNNHEDLKYTAFAFFFKQRHHLLSLIKLEESFDTFLIVRSMIEGVFLLRAAIDDPSTLTYWNERRDIENLELLEIKKRSNLEIQNGIEDEIRERLESLEHHLNKKKKEKTLKNGRQISSKDFSPYKPTLKDLKKLIEGDQTLFEFMQYLYNSASKWHHWNVFAVDWIVERSNDSWHVNKKSYKSFICHIMGIQCTLETAKICNEKLSLSKEEEIASLEKNMYAIFDRYIKKS
ncbi:MAG: DUF5677 domain-containing protein [Bdellovibrionales bacterium]